MRGIYFLVFVCSFLFAHVVYAAEKEEWIVSVQSEKDVLALDGDVLDVEGTFVKMRLTEEEAEHIRKLNFVDYVEKNEVKRAATLNDPLFFQQWSLRQIHWRLPDVSSVNLLMGKVVNIDGQSDVYDGQVIKGKNISFELNGERISRLSVRVDHVEREWEVKVLDENGQLLGQNNGSLNRLDVLLSRSSSVIHVHISVPGWTINPDIVEIKGVNHILVAVIDSGVVNHEDFGDNILYSLGVDYAEGKPYAEDTFGHGTHVTGILAATANNGVGLAGIVGQAPIDILPVKVLDRHGIGDDFNIAKGVRYALDKGASVLNLSLAGKGKTEILQNVISEAIHKGVIVVAAAGNNATSTESIYPASYVGVITVSATEAGDAPLPIANYGWDVDISAPGDQIISTYIGGYRILRGTSMATPYVAGALAVLKAIYPHEDVSQLRQRLWMSAKDIYWRGYDIYSGHGLLQWDEAINVVNPSGVDWLNIQPGQSIEQNKTYELMIDHRYIGKKGYIFWNGKLVHQFDIHDRIVALPLFEIVHSRRGDVVVVIADHNEVMAADVRLMPSSTTLFRDVSSSHWASREIYEALQYGIVRGYEDGTFRPEQILTRRQGIDMFYRAFHWKSPNSLSSPFSDVSIASDGALAILVAAEQKVIQGTNGMARLREALTRGQTALMLARVFKVKKEHMETVYPFQDVKHGELWDAVQLLAEYGVITKTKYFRPNAPITRSQFTAMLVRALTIIRQKSTKSS